jgi:hypothetical protein
MKLRNSFKCPLAAAAAVALILTSPLAFSQGKLIPPGPPEPSMKTLAQIEPRTPISSLPYYITNSGSYYVTTNLALDMESHGIAISADNVTLDLCGFTLTGGNDTISGIVVLGKNVKVRNGALRQWWSGFGVCGYLSSGVQMEDLTASECGWGFAVGTSGTIERCVAHHNYEGILVGQSYSSGASVRECTANFNNGAGIRVAGTESRIDSNLVVSNSVVGIKVEGKRNLIVRNQANKNAVGYAGNSSNYSIPAGNKWGRIVEDDGEIASGSGWENFSDPYYIP